MILRIKYKDLVTTSIEDVQSFSIGCSCLDIVLRAGYVRHIPMDSIRHFDEIHNQSDTKEASDITSSELSVKHISEPKASPELMICYPDA